jgi:sec-independent protein translocase protein TatA
MPLGVPELLVILVIVLLVLGPKRLPGIGRQLGGGMREFKDGIQGKGKDDDDPDRPQLSQSGARDEDPAARNRR